MYIASINNSMQNGWPDTAHGVTICGADCYSVCIDAKYLLQHSRLGSSAQHNSSCNTSHVVANEFHDTRRR